MSATYLVGNGDVVINQSGNLTLVADDKKLRQDYGEMLSTEIQRDGFGAGIVGLLGKESGDLHDGLQSNIEFLVRERIEAGTNRFIALQRRSLQNRPLSEQVLRINFLDVIQAPTDPTMYSWTVAIETVNHRIQTLRGSFNAQS